MATITINRECRKCNGSGILSTSVAGNPEGGAPYTNPCDFCGGTGRRTGDFLDLSDMEDKLDDLLDKCNDIFEKVNES